MVSAIVSGGFPTCFFYRHSYARWPLVWCRLTEDGVELSMPVRPRRLPRRLRIDRCSVRQVARTGLFGSFALLVFDESMGIPAVMVSWRVAEALGAGTTIPFTKMGYDDCVDATFGPNDHPWFP